MGVDIRMFLDVHAAIVIFGGDQDGRSMFPDAAKEPFEHTRKLIQKIAPQLKALPYRLSIVGHTASSKVPPKPGAMGLGNCLPIVRTPYARFWMRRVCRQGTSIWWPARPILLHVAQPPGHDNLDA
jgi:hypothetical protein